MDLFPNNQDNSLSDENFRNCTTTHDWIMKEGDGLKLLKCPLHPKCPIYQVNVDTVRSTMQDWNYTHSLCKLKKAIDQGEPTKILVFGGSVALGKSTWGCCCDSSLDSNCPTSEEILKIYHSAATYRDPELNTPEKYCGKTSDHFPLTNPNYDNKEWAVACTWTSRLQHWFKSQGLGTTVVHNEAVSASTSKARCMKMHK